MGRSLRRNLERCLLRCRSLPTRRHCSGRGVLSLRSRQGIVNGRGARGAQGSGGRRLLRCRSLPARRHCSLRGVLFLRSRRGIVNGRGARGQRSRRRAQRLHGEGLLLQTGGRGGVDHRALTLCEPIDRAACPLLRRGNSFGSRGSRRRRGGPRGRPGSRGRRARAEGTEGTVKGIGKARGIGIGTFASGFGARGIDGYGGA